MHKTRVMATDPATSFTRIVLYGKTYWIDHETFDRMSKFRARRISYREFLSRGGDPNVVDRFAVSGLQLMEGGEVTPAELSFHVPALNSLATTWSN